MPVPTVTVILKGEDWRFSRKFLIYDQVVLDEDSDQIAKCIADAKDCLKISADDCEIKTTMII